MAFLLWLLACIAIGISSFFKKPAVPMVATALLYVVGWAWLIWKNRESRRTLWWYFATWSVGGVLYLATAGAFISGEMVEGLLFPTFAFSAPFYHFIASVSEGFFAYGYPCIFFGLLTLIGYFLLKNSKAK